MQSVAAEQHGAASIVSHSSMCAQPTNQVNLPAAVQFRPRQNAAAVLALESGTACCGTKRFAQAARARRVNQGLHRRERPPAATSPPPSLRRCQQRWRDCGGTATGVGHGEPVLFLMRRSSTRPPGCTCTLRAVCVRYGPADCAGASGKRTTVHGRDLPRSDARGPARRGHCPATAIR